MLSSFMLRTRVASGGGNFCQQPEFVLCAWNNPHVPLVLREGSVSVKVVAQLFGRFFGVTVELSN